MDAIETLLEDEKEELNQAKGEKFSFTWIAEKIIERQGHEKDTIIIVVGERRNGKSTWALKLINQYIRLKREKNKDFRWSWALNYPLTRSQAIENVDKIPTGSFIVYDEGGDIAYRGDTLTLMNKKLIKFMSKSGQKKLLTIIVLPDIYLLDPKILNMAIFLVAVPYRYKDVCAFAFIYGRTPNPFIQDKFGLERIKRLFMSRKFPRFYQIPSMKSKYKIPRNKKIVEVPYPRQLFTFMRSIPTYLYSHRFIKVVKYLETSYIKNVKDKQLSIHESEESYIKRVNYEKLLYRYATLLYNLYIKQGLNYSQIERLHIDKFGKPLYGKERIKQMIDNITAKEA